MPDPVRHALVRGLVTEALGRLCAGERADRVLDRLLRAHRELSSEERSRVARWTLGLALWRERLDRFDPGTPTLRLALFLADRLQLPDAAIADATGEVPEAIRARLARPPVPTDDADRLAFERSLPPWLARRWIAQFGLAKADALAAATNEPGPISIRANRHRVTRDELRVRLAAEGVASEPSGLAPHGLRLAGRPNLFALPSWREGLFELQDEASQLVAEAVGAAPGGLVVDLCAGAGGKTLALAAAMRDTGRLVAVDPDARRLADLRVRLRRAGLGSVEPRLGDGTDPTLLEDLHGIADAVLVDAPCSGLGILRRGPDARNHLAPDEPERHAPLQAALVASGARLVRPGGALVYATCSVDRAENEAVAAAASPSGFDRELERRTWPDVEGCDGFYFVRWRRRP